MRIISFELRSVCRYTEFIYVGHLPTITSKSDERHIHMVGMTKIRCTSLPYVFEAQYICMGSRIQGMCGKYMHLRLRKKKSRE